MIYSPLEQFNVINILDLNLSPNFDLTISNSSLILIIGIVLNIIMRFLITNPTLVPNHSQLFIESYYDFLLKIFRGPSQTLGIEYD